MLAETITTNSFYRRVGKRLFDLTVGTLALLILGPPMICTAIVIRFFMGSPVLLRQPRPGFKGRAFTLLKFRTMTDERDQNGSLLADARRITPLGRILRKSSIDELPELLNVVKGEMSLVGPRPLLMQYLSRYSAQQMLRHDVPPGITGWAQVNGRNELRWDQKFELDLWYVEHQSFWIDIKILALTIRESLRRSGINEPGEATAREFMGTEGTQTKELSVRNE